MYFDLWRFRMHGLTARNYARHRTEEIITVIRLRGLKINEEKGEIAFNLHSHSQLPPPRPSPNSIYINGRDNVSLQQ